MRPNKVDKLDAGWPTTVRINRVHLKVPQNAITAPCAKPLPSGQARSPILRQQQG